MPRALKRLLVMQLLPPSPVHGGAVALLVASCLVYAVAAVRPLPPGGLRLLASLPLFVLLPAAPLMLEEVRGSPSQPHTGTCKS